MFRYLLSLLQQPEDAEDALQLTLLKAHRALAGEEPDRVFPGSWLWRIAYTTACDELRRRKVIHWEPLTGGDDADDDTPLADELTSPADDGRRFAERIAARDALRAVLSQLSPVDRDMLLRHDVDQVPVAVLAAEAGDTVEEAVARELLEETNVVVTVARLLYHHDLIDDSDQYFFDCQYVSGQLTLGGEEREETARGDIYEPMWVAVTHLPNLTLYPLEMRDWLIEDIDHGL